MSNKVKRISGIKFDEPLRTVGRCTAVATGVEMLDIESLKLEYDSLRPGRINNSTFEEISRHLNPDQLRDFQKCFGALSADLINVLEVDNHYDILHFLNEDAWLQVLPTLALTLVIAPKLTRLRETLLDLLRYKLTKEPTSIMSKFNSAEKTFVSHCLVAYQDAFPDNVYGSWINESFH